MSALWIFLGVLTIYVVFYFTYGRWVARSIVHVDDSRPTPAVEFEDDKDFAPTHKFVVFGHHFASIAGASPIIGPVIALAWGWAPALLWIILGNIFIGGIHDYLSLMASVRHQGKSIQYIASQVIKPRTGKIFAWFILFVLILVVAAFSAVVGKTFVANPSVATASMLFIAVALIMGVLMYRLKLHIVASTAIGLVLMAGSIWISLYAPLVLSYQVWLIIFFVYIIIAASLPVRVLLQPRDYLNAWLLYFGLGVAAITLIVAHKGLVLPAFTAFSAPTLKETKAFVPFWPVIPLIISCGSLSGFHSLVSSGTSSKQIRKESDGLFVGFGSMLTEGILSTLVILIVGSFFYVAFADQAQAIQGNFLTAYPQAVKDPIGIFSQSLGAQANAAFGIAVGIVATFAALWVSSFALTTLDSTNRIARYVVTELAEPLAEKKPRLFKLFSNSWLAALIPAAAGVGLAWTGSWTMIWPAFGGANQMLASIALISVAAWVLENNQGKGLIALVPALLLWFTVTAALVWYLVVVLIPQLSAPNAGTVPLLVMIIVMLGLNFILIYDFFDVLIKKKKSIKLAGNAQIVD